MQNSIFHSFLFSKLRALNLEIFQLSKERNYIIVLQNIFKSYVCLFPKKLHILIGFFKNKEHDRDSAPAQISSNLGIDILYSEFSFPY
jgi:hypothetical protein